LGQRYSLPISLYASEQFTAEQMHELRLGMLSKLNVSVFAKKEIPAEQMRAIRTEILSGYVPNETRDPLLDLRQFQMAQVLKKYPWINEGIFHGQTFSREQAEEICAGRQAGLGATLRVYVSPLFTPGQMREIRLGLVHGVDAESYAIPGYSAEQMREIRTVLEELHGKKKMLEKRLSLFREKRQAEKSRRIMVNNNAKQEER
jgi:hypothetical protein